MAQIKLRKPPDRSSMLGGATIERLEKAINEKSPIWVQNNTIDPPLQISMPYMSAEGMTAIQLPRTSVPFNLAALVPHSALSSSTSLRKLLASGSLLLLSEQEALEIIQIDVEESTATFRSAFADANNTHAARAASAPGDEEEEANDPLSREKKLARLTLAAIDPAAAARLTASESKLRGAPQRSRSRFDDIETRFAKVGIAPATVMAELRRVVDDLTTDDLTRITTNKEWCAEAQTWALKRLTALAAQKQQQATSAAASVVTPGTAPAFAIGSALSPTGKNNG